MVKTQDNIRRESSRDYFLSQLFSAAAGVWQGAGWGDTPESTERVLTSEQELKLKFVQGIDKIHDWLLYTAWRKPHSHYPEVFVTKSSLPLGIHYYLRRRNVQ
jgi:hypothetical protein